MINPFKLTMRVQEGPRGHRGTLRLSLVPEALMLRTRYRALIACYDVVREPIYFDLGKGMDLELEVPCGPPRMRITTTCFGVTPEGRVELVFRNWTPPKTKKVRAADTWTPGRVLDALGSRPSELPKELSAAARRYFGGRGAAALCAGIPVELVPRRWLKGRPALALAAAQLHLRLLSGCKDLRRLGLLGLVRRARRQGLGWRETVAEGLRLREEFLVRPLLEVPAPGRSATLIGPTSAASLPLAAGKPDGEPPEAAEAAPAAAESAGKARPAAADSGAEPAPAAAHPAAEAPPAPAESAAEAAPAAPTPPAMPDPHRPRPVRWGRLLSRDEAARLAVPENLPRFLAELDHPDPRERACAAALAGATGDARAVPALHARLGLEEDGPTIGILLEALGAVGPEGRDALAAAVRREGRTGELALWTLYAATADPARRPGLLARMARLAVDPGVPAARRVLAGQALAEWGWVSEEEAAAAGLSADPSSALMLQVWRNLHGAPLVTRRVGWQQIAARPVLAFFHPASFQESWLRVTAPLATLQEAERSLVERVDRELLEREKAVATRVTAGRNEPCPCGSGAKYKKCCGSSQDRSPLDAWIALRARPGIPLTGMRVPPYGQPEASHLLTALQDTRRSSLVPPALCTPYHRWFLAGRAVQLQQEDVATDLALQVLEDWGSDGRLDYLRILQVAAGPFQLLPLARLETLTEKVAAEGCASAVHLLAGFLARREDRWEGLPRLGDRLLALRPGDGDALAAWLNAAVQAPGLPPVSWLLGLREALVHPTGTGATLEDLRTVLDEAAGVAVLCALPLSPAPKELGPEQAPWLFHPWEGLAAINEENQRLRPALSAFQQPLPEEVSADSVEPLAREAAARSQRVEALRELYADVRRRAGEHEVEVVGRLGEAAFYGVWGDSLNLLLPRSGSRLRCVAVAAAAGRLAAELGLGMPPLEFRGGRPTMRLQGISPGGEVEEQGLVVLAQEVASELGLEPPPLYNLLLGELDPYPPTDGTCFDLAGSLLAAEAARREVHPLRLAADLGRHREPLDHWVGDMDATVPLVTGGGAVIEPPAAATAVLEDDPSALRRSLRRSCRRLLRQGQIGESHTAFENLMKGIPKHLRGKARDFFEAMAAAGLLRDKPAHYGRQISAEPDAVPALQRFVEDGTVPAAVRRAFTENVRE